VELALPPDPRLKSGMTVDVTFAPIDVASAPTAPGAGRDRR